jgi:hypothetical protein
MKVTVIPYNSKEEKESSPYWYGRSDYKSNKVNVDGSGAMKKRQPVDQEGERSLYEG